MLSNKCSGVQINTSETLRLSRQCDQEDEERREGDAKHVSRPTSLRQNSFCSEMVHITVILPDTSVQGEHKTVV